MFSATNPCCFGQDTCSGVRIKRLRILDVRLLATIATIKSEGYDKIATDAKDTFIIARLFLDTC